MSGTMTTRIAVVVALLVGGVVGGLAVHLLGGGGAAEPVSSTGGETNQRPAAAIEQERQHRRRTEAVATPREPSVTEPAAAKSAPAEPTEPPQLPPEVLEAMHQELAKPAQERPTGRVTGRVFRAGTSEGVAGVLVEAAGEEVWSPSVDSSYRTHSPMSYRSSLPPPPFWQDKDRWPDAQPGKPIDLVEAVKAAVVRAKEMNQQYFFTHTGPDGSFTLEGLPEGIKYRIRARAAGLKFELCDDEGFPYSRPDAEYASVRTGDQIHFSASEIWQVPLSFVMPDGRELEHCFIQIRKWPTHLRTEDPVAAMNQTKSGSFQYPQFRGKVMQIEPGDYVIWADTNADLAGHIVSDPVRLNRWSSADGVLRIPVRQVPCVVSVVHRQARPNTSFCVAVLPWMDRTPTVSEITDAGVYVGPDYGRGDSRPSINVHTELPAGRYLAVLMDRGSGSILDMKDVELRGEAVTVELFATPRQRRDFVHVRVYGPDGKPVNRIELATRYREPTRMSYSEWSRPKLNADGVFEMTHPSVPSGTPPPLVVSARHPEWGEVSVDYQRKEAPEAVIRFAKPAMLTVLVDGLAGGEMPAGVGVRIDRGDNTIYGDRLADQFRIGPMQAGSVAVTLSSYLGFVSSDTQTIHMNLVRTEVQLFPGENVVRMQYPKMATLTITAPNAKPGDRVYISRSKDEHGKRLDEHWSAFGELNYENRAKLTLPMGTYYYSVSKASDQGEDLSGVVMLFADKELEVK